MSDKVQKKRKRVSNIERRKKLLKTWSFKTLIKLSSKKSDQNAVLCPLSIERERLSPRKFFCKRKAKGQL